MPLYLYLYVTDQSMSLVSVKEKNQVEQPIYFVSKVFKDVKARYQKIERLALEVVIAAWKLKTYFQGHIVTMKTNYPIQKVLKKLDLARRILS